jgi:hypothetical protein
VFPLGLFGDFAKDGNAFAIQTSDDATDEGRTLGQLSQWCRVEALTCDDAVVWENSRNFGADKFVAR